MSLGRGRAAFGGARVPLPALVLTALLATSACALSEKGKPAAERAALGGDVVARVGTETLTRGLVAEVARAQRITPEEATRRLVDDAVAAAAARERGLDTSPDLRWRLVAARARTTSDRLLAEARALGPPTDEEVNELSRRHWAEVDRPPCSRVVHAVVKLPKDGKAAAKEADARALATRMRPELLVVTDAESFKKRAEGFAEEAKSLGLSITAEELVPFDATGRTLEGGSYVDAFVAAGTALTAAGETSGVVQTEFGFHVLRLLERLPEQRMPFETRRIAFSDEVVMRRARTAYQAVVDAQRTQTPIEVLPSADTSMRELHGAERRR